MFRIQQNLYLGKFRIQHGYNEVYIWAQIDYVVVHALECVKIPHKTQIYPEFQSILRSHSQRYISYCGNSLVRACGIVISVSGNN